MAQSSSNHRGLPDAQPSASPREVDEELRGIVKDKQKFQTVIMNMPGHLLDLPQDQHAEKQVPSYFPKKKDHQTSAPNPLRPERRFWKISEPLCPDRTHGNEISPSSSTNETVTLSLSLQRTQLYTNGEIGFLPALGKNLSVDPGSLSSYHSAVWSLFAALESSGLRRFTIDRQRGEKDTSLYGGREDVAEGASYRIATRFMRFRGQQKLVAVIRVKGSLSTTGSKPGDQIAGINLELIRKDIEIMTRPQYRSISGHPHILTCLGYGWEAADPLSSASLFLVVPWAQRGTLRQFLQSRDISWPTRKEVFKQICLGLRSLHLYDIAHGDVKMENVLVFNRPHLETEEGRRQYEESWKTYPQVPPIEENVNVRLSDFGSSVTESEGRYTGTAAYNAPEVRGGRLFTSSIPGQMMKFMKCDIYSVGLLYLEVLLGGESVASNARVQDMTRNADGFLPALEFARETVSDVLSHPMWRGRQLDIAQDLFLQILEATLQFDPEDRYPVDFLLKMIERATWRATFDSDDHPILQSLTASSDQTLLVYDPIHQLDHDTDKLIEVPFSGIDIESMPRPMVSRLFTSWYDATVNGTGQATKKAADLLVTSCFDREWTKVTTVDDFLSLLDKLVRLGSGHSAIFVYYRLLFSLGRELPTVKVGDSKCQRLLDLERRFLTSEAADGPSYQYRRTMAYRTIMRARVQDALLTELGATGESQGNNDPGDILTRIWKDGARKHLFDKWGVVAWLCKIDCGPVLREVLTQHRQLIHENANLAFDMIMAAGVSGHLENMECILETAQLSLSSYARPDGLSPLHHLSIFEAYHVQRALFLLVRAGFDTNAHVDQEQGFRIDFWPEIKFWGTPLSVAVMLNREDIVCALLDNNADLLPRKISAFGCPGRLLLSKVTIDMNHRPVPGSFLRSRPARDLGRSLMA